MSTSIGIRRSTILALLGATARHVRGIRRSRLLALAILTLTAAALTTVDRQHVRIVRRGQSWTVEINGKPKGTLQESGERPLHVDRVSLFLTGGFRRQRWERVRIVTPAGVERRDFFREGLGPWSPAAGDWSAGLFGAWSQAGGESRLERRLGAKGNLAFEATMVAGQEGGIVFEDPETRERVRFWMRPARHHDATFGLWRDGQEEVSLAVGPVGLDLSSAVGDLGRQLIPILLVALALALVLGRSEPGGAEPSAAPRWISALAVAAALAFLITATWIERETFDSMPHVQDGVALIFQARNFALGRLSSPSPPEPRFFDHEFVINDGRWFGKYAPGASLLYAAGLFARELDLVNPLLGAGTILLLFALARRLYGTAEGLVTVALASCSPFLLLITASYLAHPATLFFLTASMVLFLGPPRLGRYGIAGLSLGAAVLTRPQSAFASALPFIAWAAIRFLRNREERAALLVCGAGALAGVLLLGAYDHALTGSPWKMPFQLYSAYDRLGFGAVGVEWPGEFGVEMAISNLAYDLGELGPSLSRLGWIFLALPLLPFFTGGVRRDEALLGLSALSVAGLFFFYFHAGVFLGPRYWYEATPAVLVLASRGITRLCAALGALWLNDSTRKRVAASAAAVLTLALAIATSWELYSRLPTFRGLNGMSRRLLAAGENISRKAIVFVDSKRSWQPYGSAFWTLWPDLERNRVIYAREGGIYNVHPDADPLPNTKLTELFPDRKAYRWDGRRLAPFD